MKLFVEAGRRRERRRRLRHHAADGRRQHGRHEIIQYLVDVGADLGAFDLGKKNDGAFGASVEPLMPVDYAIGVGTFVPNNAVIIHEDAAR